MALTVDQLREAMLLPDTPRYIEIVTRLHSVGYTMVEAHAPDAPDAMKDEAVVCYAGRLYHNPPSGDNYDDFYRSGAVAMLRRWHVPGVVSVGGDDNDVEETDLDPSDPVTPPTPALMPELIAGWSATNMPTIAEFAAGVRSDTNSLTIPAAVGGMFFWIFRNDDGGGDPTEVYVANSNNWRNSFGAASRHSVDAMDGDLIVSVNTFNANFLSGESLRVV